MSLDLALRAAALLAAGTALGWATQSLSPSARHLLWHGTVMATLALPLTSLVSPAWSVPGVSTGRRGSTRYGCRSWRRLNPGAPPL